MKQSETPIQKTGIVIAALIIAAFGLYFFSNTFQKDNVNLPAGSKLKVEVKQEGSGQTAENGNEVSVHYTGRLKDGTKFDSSLDRGTPFVFTLGAGQVIKGWDQGILGMRAGEKRLLTIPPELGYGGQGTPGGPIPPDSTLLFEVELVGIGK